MFALPSKKKNSTQSLNNKKDHELYKAVYKSIKKQDQKKLNDIARKCKQLFNQEADPSSVLTKLEESLIGQEEYYKYYIENFLPALLRETIQSNNLGLEKIEQILIITSSIVKRSNQYEDYIQYLETLLSKIKESSALCKDDKKKAKLGKIEEIITEIISKSNYQIDLRNSQINRQDNAGTSKPIHDLGSRASSPVLNKTSPPSSPLSSRRNSISATLSSVEEDDDLQKRNENQTQPEQPAKKEQNTQENENSSDQANPIGNGNPQKRNEDQMQLPKQNPEEKPKKQKNENSEPIKQPNNRNYRIALATCCALSVGCLIAGIVTLGMVGTGLFVMSVVFATLAAVTRYLSPPSSGLTSTDLSPLIDNNKQR